MITIKNEKIKIEVNEGNGLICGLFSHLGDFNIADQKGFGDCCYTLFGDDISTDVDFCPYIDKTAEYESVCGFYDKIVCKNSCLGIETKYLLTDDGLIINSNIKNSNISEFGINFNFNFLGKKASGYDGQLLPSSPYTSYDKKRMYCIMPIINHGFCIVASTTICDGWKIDYSSYSAGHFIHNFKMFASFDSAYSGRQPIEEKSITVEIAFEKTIYDCLHRLHKIYGCPVAYADITGTFEKKLTVQFIGDTKYVEIIYPNKQKPVKRIDLECGQTSVTIETDTYGLCSVVPYGIRRGLDTSLWFGKNMGKIFEKSCNAVKKPYHNDFNLCEGMVWLWSLLSYMSFYHEKKYIKKVDKMLKVIMSDTDNTVDRLSILPYAYNGYPSYHIKNSDRIQEEFFGISILTEAYKLTDDEKYIDFAYQSAKCMIDTYQQTNGALVCKHGDYTTVCSPIISIIDLAEVFKYKDRERSDYLYKASKKIVEFLINRGTYFPTETQENEFSNTEMEEGSMACTALSVLYYCYHVQFSKRYIEFAENVLRLHDWWRIYTPDARLYMSTMRWWETIWEGDGTGPAICGGHAWSIWRAEADYYMGILTADPKYMLDSWNGFVTNFSKIQRDGTNYACYQPDYITGGGIVNIRKGLLQLKNEDVSKKYELTHGYPKHCDNSLSRYVWVRAQKTWLKTAAVIKKGNHIIPINCVIKEKTIIIDDNITTLYVSGIREKYKIYSKNKLKLAGDYKTIELC